MMRYLLSLLATLLALAPSGAQTQSAALEGFDPFATGSFKGVGLSWEGGLRAGPWVDQVAIVPGVSIVWDLVPAPGGGFFVATGNPGGVYHVAGDDSTATLVFDADRPLVRGLAVDEDGDLFVGVSPGGRIYRLPAEDRGSPEIHAQLPVDYIWGLEIDPDDGSLWVSTGLPGAVYRLPASHGAGATARPVWETDDLHVTSFLANPDRNGAFWAGTSPGGRIYRVAPGGEKLLFAHAGTEIGRIDRKEDGVLEFVALSDGSGEGNGNGKGANDPGPALPPGLYRLGKDGFVEQLWGREGEEIHALGRGADAGFTDLLGTAGGRFYAFRDRFSWSLLGELSGGGEISVIRWTEDGNAVIASSNPARVYLLRPEPTVESFYETPVLPADQRVRWGKVLLRGDGLDYVRMETRSGEQAEPGADWSGWEPVGGNGQVRSPAGRFLQVRLNFVSPEAVVRRLETFYRIPNQAPAFRRISYLPVKLDELPTPPENRPRVSFPQLFQGDGESNGNGGDDGRLSFLVDETPGWISVFWEVRDPNGDEMRHRVDLRPSSATSATGWFPLAADLELPFYSFPSDGMPDGAYELRVTSTDQPSHPEGEGLRSEGFGSLVVIDNASPQISVTAEGRQLRIRVRDAFSVIKEAGVRFDGGERKPLFPRDGMMDSANEVFETEVPEGVSVVWVEALDSRGNRAVELHRME